jgi:hypothetical protein
MEDHDYRQTDTDMPFCEELGLRNKKAGLFNQ